MSDTETLSDLQHLYKLFYDDLGICGCGNPEYAYALVRDLLALAPFHQHPGKIRERIGGPEPDPGTSHLVLSMLTTAGLIEHGGGIGGSWLTPKGTRYLELMKRHEWDDLDDTDGYGGSVGYPHDGKDCPPACRHHHPERVTVNAGDLEEVLAMFSPRTLGQEESAQRLGDALRAADPKGR